MATRLLRWSLLTELVLPLLTLVGAACTGDIGDDGAGNGSQGGGSSTPTSFVCDESLDPQALPLRRLSRVQYQNTIGDLVRYALPDEAPLILGEIAPLFAQVPEDLRLGPDKHYAKLSRLDQAVQQEHIDATYAVATAVGASLTADAGRLAAVVGACATDGDTENDDACLDDFIVRFGERSLRREVTTADVAFYRAVAGVAPFEPADYGDVIGMLLVAPHTLYFVEHGEDGTDARVRLSPYEIAARLSYHFWQTMPDEALLTAARSGELATDEGYRTQVDRVFADPRTREAVRSFFAEWLENSTLEELDSRLGTKAFDALAGDFTPGPDLREHMLEEVTDAAVYYAFEGEGDFDAFFQSSKSFARTDDLASLYGAPLWDGGPPPDMTDPARVGLITRAAFLATGSANTRPIMKGVFLRKALLCDEIPAPPANAAATPPELSETSTTRQVVEQLTNTGSCAGCHATLINGLGFATENFDPLGRVRAEQSFFDADSGELIGSGPIDTTSVPRVSDGDPTESAGAADLSRLLLESEKPYACFTRHYFRFTFGRMEDLNRDGCALADVKASLDAGAPLAEALRAIALTKAFRDHTFDEAGQ